MWWREAHVNKQLGEVAFFRSIFQFLQIFVDFLRSTYFRRGLRFCCLAGLGFDLGASGSSSEFGGQREIAFSDTGSN